MFLSITCNSSVTHILSMDSKATLLELQVYVLYELTRDVLSVERLPRKCDQSSGLCGV